MFPAFFLTSTSSVVRFAFPPHRVTLPIPSKGYCHQPACCRVTLSLLAKDAFWNYLKFFGTHSPPHRAASSSESVRVLLHLELSLQAFKITKRSKRLRARRLVRRSRLASTTTSRSQLGVASASLRRSAVGGRQGCKKGSAHPCGGKSSSAPEVFAGATLFPR